MTSETTSATTREHGLDLLRRPGDPVNPTDARNLLERLLHRIAPEVDLADVDPGVVLEDVLDLDSMDLLNLMTALAEETGIDVPERDYPLLSSIDGFVSYVSAAAQRGSA